MYFNLGILVFILANLIPGKANAEKSQDRVFTINGVGTAKVVHEDLGEPLAAPERLKVTVVCKHSGKSIEVKLFRFCKLETVAYDSTNKTISLKLISARVVPNTGQVICDQVDEKEVDLTKVCHETKPGK